MSAIFQVSNAVIYRFQQKVFGPFSYTFEKDCNYVISGLNGVGKTSFLQAIKGSLPLRSGKIDFLINYVGGIYEWKRKNIELVSFADTTREFLNTQRYYQQRFHAFDTDDFTVEEYLSKAGYDSNDKHHKDIINRCGLSGLMSLARIKLSSGQSRNFLIAKALMKTPSILLLDNPYVGLDKENRLLLNNLIDQLSSESDIQFIITGQFTDLPKSIHHIIKFSPDVSDEELDIPKSLFNYFNDTSHWQSFNSVLDLKDVTIEYEEKTILHKLNWQVKKGDKCSILGQNGSGKSTLIGLIAADHPQVYKNNISLFGKRRSNRDSIWDIKKNIGLVSSELHTYFHDPELNCFTIVKQGLHATIYNNPTFTKREENAILDLFNFFDLSDLKDKSFRQCSTGEQRVILFMRAVIKNPPLLLLDEPFQALDTRQLKRAKFLLEQILTVDHSLIFITHFKHETPDCVDYTLEL